MASSFSLTIKRETNLISSLRNHSKAVAIAEAGVTLAQLHLLKVDKDQRWRTNGNIYATEFNGAKLRLQIRSEAGKIDLNYADEKSLQGMMRQTDLDEEKQQALVSAILDWRDGDDLTRMEGAEANQYQAANLAYQPRNKPFQTLEELRLVFGITADLYQQLSPMLTVYSKTKKVDLKNASRRVLLAVSGRNQEGIDDYIKERVESDQNNTPEPKFIGYRGFSLQSKVYSVISEAQIDGGAKARIQVIMKKNTAKNKPPFKILNWTRTPLFKNSLFSNTMTALLITEDAELNL
jgi:general secretion pathway protein K